jgi:hypothetical protein
MKYTSEDLMKAMGLQVGDKVKLSAEYYTFIFKVKLNEYNKPYLLGEEKQSREITILLDQDFEILPRPKRVGQLTCREIKDCRTCPLWWICFIKINEKDEMKTSLYEMLESFAVKDQEIYDLLKARLDKEVVEE